MNLFVPHSSYQGCYRFSAYDSRQPLSIQYSILLILYNLSDRSFSFCLYIFFHLHRCYVQFVWLTLRQRNIIFGFHWCVSSLPFFVKIFWISLWLSFLPWGKLPVRAWFVIWATVLYPQWIIEDSLLNTMSWFLMNDKKARKERNLAIKKYFIRLVTYFSHICAVNPV